MYLHKNIYSNLYFSGNINHEGLCKLIPKTELLVGCKDDKSMEEEDGGERVRGGRAAGSLACFVSHVVGF